MNYIRNKKLFTRNRVPDLSFAIPSKISKLINLGEEKETQIKKKKILTFVRITVALSTCNRPINLYVILVDECYLVRVSNNVTHKEQELEVKEQN